MLAEGPAVVMIHIWRPGRVEMDHVHAVGILLLQAARIRLVAARALHRELEIDQGNRKAGRVGGPDHASGRFANAKVSGQVAGHIDSQRQRTADDRKVSRGVTIGEIENDLSIDLHAINSQLAIFMLGTVALKSSDPADASGPGEDIGQADLEEFEPQSAPSRIRRQINAKHTRRIRLHQAHDAVGPSELQTWAACLASVCLRMDNRVAENGNRSRR